jgi:hypothetical protein
VLKFLVCGCSGDEEALLVTVAMLVLAALVLSRSYQTYPAVSLPMILVPAMVAWQMGITSWSSASKTLLRDCQYNIMVVFACAVAIE